MSNKKLLIASSSRDEAITKWVLKSQYNNSSINVLFVDELLNQYDIRDVLDDNNAKICWYEDNVLKFSNETHYLLNRVVYLQDVLWDKFKAFDKEYAKREFEAYLGFAFNSFETVQHIATNGLCERNYSLPQQWHLVNKNSEIKVPDYYWGISHFNPFKNTTGIVYSTIYDYLNWSLSSPSKQNKTEFCFKKPTGNPVFVLSIGDGHLITTDHCLQVNQVKIIEEELSQIRELFDCFIFELLIFVSEDQLTFGCINTDIIRSTKNPLFDSFLNDNLLQEYYKCLN